MSEANASPASPDDRRRAALRFVLLLGLVSLLADMTYEGARSITGPYLGLLGAGAAAVGIVAGLGELIGYGLRLASGYLADRTRSYWTITIVGYAVNLLAVPLLALAGSWQAAAGLMIAERLGKAVRTPARDVMLSHATSQVGRGWGFGLHEAMDQLGAMAGPLLVAAILAARGSMPAAFLVLSVPAVLALAALLAGRALYPQPRGLERSLPPLTERSLPRRFWLYLAAAACIAAGFADFPLIAFHLQHTAVVGVTTMPLLYALAMGVDAVAALLFGRLFDRFGLAVVAGAGLLAAPAAPLVFLGGAGSAVAGTVLWGIGMGAQESVLRAAVAELVPAERRGTAYGLFNAAYGFAWFAGSALMGLLYQVSLPAVAIFAAAMPVLALAPFLALTWRAS
ncbi:MAG: MFS transporter [Thermoanaerobaculales bacterium]|nr:MFS transporter [Thermoanaerobaculales bacterium]